MNKVQREPTVSVGVRLPKSLWEAIDAQAKDHKLTRNEWLRPQIEAVLLRAPIVAEEHKESPDDQDMELE